MDRENELPDGQIAGIEKEFNRIGEAGDLSENELDAVKRGFGISLQDPDVIRAIRLMDRSDPGVINRIFVYMVDLFQNEEIMAKLETARDQDESLCWLEEAVQNGIKAFVANISGLN